MRLCVVSLFERARELAEDPLRAAEAYENTARAIDDAERAARAAVNASQAAFNKVSLPLINICEYSTQFVVTIDTDVGRYLSVLRQNLELNKCEFCNTLRDWKYKCNC